MFPVSRRIHSGKCTPSRFVVPALPNLLLHDPSSRIQSTYIAGENLDEMRSGGEDPSGYAKGEL
jgi:hypothetical protein